MYIKESYLKNRIVIFVISLVFILVMTFILIYFVGLDSKKITLASEEKLWLLENSITLSVDDKYTPMNYRNEEGELEGLTIDYIRLIEKKLNTTIKFDAHSWPEALSNAMEYKTDGIVNVNPTPLRDQKLIYTEPYIKIPMALFTRFEESAYISLKDLNGKTIVVKRDTVEASFIPQNYPGITILEVDTYHEALSLLVEHRVDGVFGHLIVVNYDLERYNFIHLKVNFLSFNEIITQQRVGVRRDNPILHSILDKAISDITEEEHLLIRDKWITPTIIKYDLRDNYPE